MGSERERVDLRLTSTLDAPAVARRFVQQHSDDLPDALVADAELLVSELVTNAVVHGRPEIRMRLRLDPPVIGVAVSDGGAEFDAPDDTPSADDPHGRGLHIVSAVSRKHGISSLPDGTGKTVWFELTAADYSDEPAVEQHEGG